MANIKQSFPQMKFKMKIAKIRVCDLFLRSLFDLYFVFIKRQILLNDY